MIEKPVRADAVSAVEALTVYERGGELVCPVCSSRVVTIPAALASGSRPMGLECPVSMKMKTRGQVSNLNPRPAATVLPHVPSPAHRVSRRVYHVTSRGDRRESIFEDDDDRRALLGVVAHGLERFDAQMLAYCLMGNHYHFVLHTRAANLSLLMRHINGVYTRICSRSAAMSS